VKLGTTDLLECESCDGTWLEASAFERLCADRESQAGMLNYSPSDNARLATARQPPESIHYRPCPRCGKLMNRMNFARLSGTVVDVCKGHGTFLDRGELHQVVRFILEGGFDRVRRIEREELIEEQRRLSDLQRALLDR
jgi:Zn-finger nucleic acid-binding protein